MSEETWITITEDHVREALADGEYDVFSNLALTPGSDPVVGGCIRRVVNRVRGEVAASGRYTLGPAGTVPPELESAAIHLLRRELATRIPQAGITFDKLREMGIADAVEQLKDARKGELGITPPETPSTSMPPPDSGAWGSEPAILFPQGPP